MGMIIHNGLSKEADSGATSEYLMMTAWESVNQSEQLKAAIECRREGEIEDGRG
jgi:hypothetical protein